MFAGAAAVEYAERLYAAVEDRKRPHPAQNGEGEGVDARLGGINRLGKARLQLPSHIRVCLERLEGGESRILDIIGSSEYYRHGGECDIEGSAT